MAVANFDFDKMLAQAKQAKSSLSLLDENAKNKNLESMAEGIKSSQDAILEANSKDIELAKANGLSPALIDRLLLNAERIDSMVEAIEQIIELPDPIGDVLDTFYHKGGMKIEKVRVPIGMIAVIYESRPNVTSDVAALCLKAGNGVILRGGKEAINSNIAIYNAMMQGVNLGGAIQLMRDPDRELVKKLVQSDKVIDLIIPRGGYELSQTVSKLSTIPVIKHDKGLCHVYVDKSCDLKKALDIVINAKCQRPGVCNAMETLLVDSAIADKFLPKVAEKLKEHNCEIRADEPALAFIPDAKLALEDDWDAEYLDLILAIKIVDGVTEAITHIQKYGSNHSDAIVAEDKSAQAAFARQVGSACVYINASTRFTDGGEFGMGAEIGISTNKLHARGPMGLKELTTYQYLLTGSGDIRV
jgi:glutamate-5-semialdehyde dehydrogenase